jgi:hypothetical protein
VAPPPVFPPEPAATTASGEHRERALDAGRCARLPALIATLSGPDREIVSLRVVAGVSIPDIVAALGVTLAASRLAEHQALGALQPAASANARRGRRGGRRGDTRPDAQTVAKTIGHRTTADSAVATTMTAPNSTNSTRSRSRDTTRLRRA